MPNGWGHDTNFSRTSLGVLDHLSTTSGLPTWLLTRTNAGVSQVLAVVDPSATIRIHQSVAKDIGEGAGSRIAVPMMLSDGRLFGELVGFGSAPLPYHEMESLRTTADAFATVLGALAYVATRDVASLHWLLGVACAWWGVAAAWLALRIMNRDRKSVV